MDSYEQKYKEALENARQEYNTTENVERKQWLEELFPELAESEDERIRKALICGMYALKEQHKTCFASIPIDNAIAWLEKQGNPTDINPSEFDLHLNKLLKQFETLPKEELVSSLSFYLNVVQNDGTYKDEEKQGEQKPTDEEMKELLRTEYGKGRADAIAEMQKRAWSEEDESYLNTTIAYLKDAKEFKKSAENCINWLKSLKDRVQPRRRHTIFDEII